MSEYNYKKSNFDPKKFVFSETFTNTDGKTSGSGFIGVILGLVAAAAFTAAMVGYFLQIPNTVEVMGEMLKLVAASTILLGVRKVAPKFGNGKTTVEENKTTNNNISSDVYLETHQSPKG